MKIQTQVGNRILLLQSASGHVQRSSRTVPHQERSPIPQIAREVVPAGDQEAEDGAEDEDEDEGEGDGEGDGEAATVKLGCQPVHLERNGMMLTT